MTEQISRRSFLKTAGLSAAVLGVTLCGGGSALALATQPVIDKPVYSSYAAEKKEAILLTYATRAGSTAEIAVRMGEILEQRGLSVDVKPIEGIHDLAPYRSVVLGSAIRAGKVLKEVRDFVEVHQTALAVKPFSVFIVCMTLHEDTPETRAKAGGFLDPLRAMVKPTQEGLFAGKMDPDRLGMVDRMLAGAVQIPVGDFRRWDLIDAWAENLVL